MEMVFIVVILALIVAMIVGMWKVFEKAGQPGWAAIVPIYNIYILTIEIAKKEIVWFILWIVGIFCTPLYIVAAVVVGIAVAKKFGQSDLFGVGLGLLGFIFYPILGFGDAQYEGGRGKSSLDDEKW